MQNLKKDNNVKFNSLCHIRCMQLKKKSKKKQKTLWHFAQFPVLFLGFICIEV